MTPTATNEDTALIIAAAGVLSNDTDGDSDTRRPPLHGPRLPANGSLTLNADGSFTYTPNANFTGSDSFTYKAMTARRIGGRHRDDHGHQRQRQPGRGQRHAPRWPRTAPTTRSTSWPTTHDGVDSGETLTVTAVSDPANGTARLGGLHGTGVSYTPDANYFGADSLHLHDQRRQRRHRHGDRERHGHQRQRQPGRGRRRATVAEDSTRQRHRRPGQRPRRRRQRRDR